MKKATKVTKPAAAKAAAKAAPKAKKPSAKTAAPTKAAAKTEPKAAAKPKYTRIMASVEFITAQLKGKVNLVTTADQLYTGANNTYIKHGGTDNIKEAKYSMNRTLDVLTALGKAVRQDEAITVHQI